MSAAYKHLRKFVAEQSWGYHALGPNATEPATLASLALLAHEKTTEVEPLVEWLAGLQAPDGSVGVMHGQQRPAWPTSLAALAWLAYDQKTQKGTYESTRIQAEHWILNAEGKTTPKQPQMGHDSTIVGWSWADDTHAWIEPTSFFVLALRALNLSSHQRAREGTRLIIDRLHKGGGCNYGNTVVLGQATLAHVQPTGIAMLALFDKTDEDPRIPKSLDYLISEISENSSTASLCFALLGLTAHNRRPPHAEQLLQGALTRELQRGTSCYKLALLTLAEMKDLHWLPKTSQLGLVETSS